MGLDLAIIQVTKPGTFMPTTGSLSSPTEITRRKQSTLTSIWIGMMFYKFLLLLYLKSLRVRFVSPTRLHHAWQNVVTSSAYHVSFDTCIRLTTPIRSPKRKLAGRNVRYVGIPCIYPTPDL